MQAGLLWHFGHTQLKLRADSVTAENKRPPAKGAVIALESQRVARFRSHLDQRHPRYRAPDFGGPPVPSGSSDFFALALGARTRFAFGVSSGSARGCGDCDRRVPDCFPPPRPRPSSAAMSVLTTGRGEARTSRLPPH